MTPQPRIQTTKTEPAIERRIRRIIGTQRLTAWDIAKGIEYAYRNDYYNAITRMADQGRITRTWDETGQAFYQNK